MIFVLSLFIFSAFVSPPFVHGAQEECSYRGDLDRPYCDEDYDLTADSPKDPKMLKNPSTLVFSYTSVEKYDIYKERLADFLRHVSRVTGKKIIHQHMDSVPAQIEAMRQGRLHIASFSTGPTCFAVNLAGYVPFAAKGNQNGFTGYSLVVLVRQDSPYKNLEDLKGKKVAHSSPASHSGHLAPVALFPFFGILPGRDYHISFSGGHDQSITGLGKGDYDAACTASSVYERMAFDGRIKAEDYRIIWQSAIFPSSSLGYAHNLAPELVAQIKEAFTSYRFSPELQAFFGGADRFCPINYKDDYEVIRAISRSKVHMYDRKGFKKQNIDK